MASFSVSLNSAKPRVCQLGRNRRLGSTCVSHLV